MLCLSSNKRQTPTWKRKFKVGDELERNKRIELHAKVTSLSGKLRKAFLASDESGDSKLQPDEVKEMLHKWGKDLKDDEISLLENFLWKADRNGDGVLEYDEFVNRLAEFEQSLQFDRANQVSHEAMTALVNSKLWKEIERNRREIIAEMARSATSGIRSMSKGEVWEALGRVKGMKFTDEIKEWFIAAANTWDEERFNAGSLFDRSSEAGGFDIANFNFMRDTVKDLRPTHMSPEKLAEYKAKALARMERMRPKIENLISKLTLQVGNSLHRAFRALDDNKTGVLNAEKIYNGFKRHGVKISEEEAGEIVQACDINGDGHIELIDFQNLFTDEVKVRGGSGGAAAGVLGEEQKQKKARDGKGAREEVRGGIRREEAECNFPPQLYALRLQWTWIEIARSSSDRPRSRRSCCSRCGRTEGRQRGSGFLSSTRETGAGRSRKSTTPAPPDAMGRRGTTESRRRSGWTSGCSSEHAGTWRSTPAGGLLLPPTCCRVAPCLMSSAREHPTSWSRRKRRGGCSTRGT
mmetsp:Transcript_39185/g.123538  ORF Transcript_39185/g.123538 Transcript_39185/m.123538 type:complete len:523 (-) Transcript_39185:620-2188(-)